MSVNGNFGAYLGDSEVVDQQIWNRFTGSLMTACMDLLTSILLLSIIASSVATLLPRSASDHEKVCIFISFVIQIFRPAQDYCGLFRLFRVLAPPQCLHSSYTASAPHCRDAPYTRLQFGMLTVQRHSQTCLQGMSRPQCKLVP